MKLINGRTTQQHIHVFAFCYLAATAVYVVWGRLVCVWKSHFVERELPVHNCMLRQTDVNNLRVLVGIAPGDQETCFRSVGTQTRDQDALSPHQPVQKVQNKELEDLWEEEEPTAVSVGTQRWWNCNWFVCL